MFLIERNLPKERHAYSILDIPAALYPCIKEEFHQEPHSWKCKTKQKSQQQNLGPVWSYRTVAARSLVDDLCVIVNHRLRKGIFLTFVQQEEIQRLLNLLLTLDRKKFAFLLRNRKHPCTGPLLLTYSIVITSLKIYYHVVHRAHNRLFHGSKGIIEFLNDRVLLAALLNKLVPAKLDGIILINLTHHARVLKSGICRNKVSVLCRVVEILLDIFREAYLGLESDGIGSIFLSISHGSAGL